jgi:hypothetical protein
MGSMTKFQALMSIATTLIGQAPAGYANPHNPSIDGVLKAIVAVTTDDWEAETLVKIAWWETGFRKEYVDCTTVVSKARGAFQVVPFTRAEVLDACSSNFEIQAKLARDRLRSSRAQCERLGFRGSDVIGIYTTGKCQRNEPFAKVRFGDGTLLRSLMNQQ